MVAEPCSPVACGLLADGSAVFFTVQCVHTQTGSILWAPNSFKHPQWGPRGMIGEVAQHLREDAREMRIQAPCISMRPAIESAVHDAPRLMPQVTHERPGSRVVAGTKRAPAGIERSWME